VKSRPIIAFLSDFGLKDPYVGICKGIMASLNTEALVTDITHLISPQNILQAAIYLEASVPYFPKKTIFLSVVDPGVGSKRACLVIKDGSRTFVGPDNGLFSLSIDSSRKLRTYVIERDLLNELLAERGIRTGASSTFHGRDIFSPAAALLSLGIEPERFCSILTRRPLRFNIPEPDISQKRTEGAILYFDHFGNAATNIKSSHLSLLSCLREDLVVKLCARDGKRLFIPIKKTFSMVEPEASVAYINSFGFLEIAVNMADAKKELGLFEGQRVMVLCKGEKT